MSLTITVLCMVLLGIVGSLVSTVAGLTGLKLAPLGELATLPNSMIAVFTAIGAIPAAAICNRYRRRPVLIIGGLVGIAATLQMSWAVLSSSFWLFVLGTAILGLASAPVGFVACFCFYYVLLTRTSAYGAVDRSYLFDR